MPIPLSESEKYQRDIMRINNKKNNWNNYKYYTLGFILGIVSSWAIFLSIQKDNQLHQYDSAICDMYRSNRYIESWQYKDGTWSPYTDNTVQAPMSKVK